MQPNIQNSSMTPQLTGGPITINLPQQTSQPGQLILQPHTPAIQMHQPVVQIVQPPGMSLQITNNPLPLLNPQGQFLGTISGFTNHTQLLNNLQNFTTMMPNNRITQPNVPNINTGLSCQQQPISTLSNMNGLQLQQSSQKNFSVTQQPQAQLMLDQTTGMYQLVQNAPQPLLQNNQNKIELVNTPTSFLPAPLATSVMTPQITTKFQSVPIMDTRNCSTPNFSPAKCPKLLLPSTLDTKENKPVIESKPTKFMCGVCNKSFGNTKNLRVHISEIHEGNRGQFPCDFPGCDKVFPRKRNMERHKNAIHLKNNPQCHLCHKTVVNIDMHIKRFHKDSADIKPIAESAAMA